MLNSLISISKKRAKRVGRGLGSGKGAKSGRGTTRHQKARESIPLWFEGGQNKITKKFPLLRGKERNKPVKKHITLRLDKLNQLKDNSYITFKTLKNAGYIPNGIRKNNIQIRIVKGKTKLTKKLHFLVPVTSSVKKEVVAMGGTTL